MTAAPFVRVIPCLLLSQRTMVKTRRFADPRYLGDPINILRIFNEKESDELCLLDIGATPAGQPPDFDYLLALADECFMPLSYGGGIASLEHCERLFRIGFEKVVLNTAAMTDPALVTAVAERFGSQSLTVALDVATGADGRACVMVEGGRRDTGLDPVAAARRAVGLGAGEILLTAVDREGTMEGYDLDLVRAVASAVDIPVIAHGGAGRLSDLVEAVRDGGAAAVAAGSLFVYYGRHRAVLINPPRSEAFQAALAAAADGQKETPG